MKLKEIMQMLEEMCPRSFAMSWDNVGLQVGYSDKEVRTIALALDATSEVIASAKAQGADLILTHHPLLFGGIKNVTDTDYVGKRILDLIRSDICCYSMHTNFDVLGMADAAADLLHLSDREVAEVFDIGHVRYYGDPDQMLVTCAILPGSGKSEIDLAVKAGADVYITGDISHHDGIDAVEKGVAVIDAGHYGIEKIFIPYMKEYLEREMPELRIVSCDAGAPFIET